MNAPRNRSQHSAARELGLLLRLRARGLRRPRTRGRAGSAAPRGRPVWTRYLALVVVAALIAFFGTSLLLTVVGGTVGRLLLGPLLIWTSTAATLFVFLLAIPLVLATFTYNSDLKLLLLTPLSPRLLMVEKVVSLYLQITPLLLLVGIPTLLGVGRALGLGMGYSLATIAALLLVPVAPLALAMVVQVAVLRWLPPRMARTATAVFGILISLVAYIGIQVFTGQSGKQQRTATTLQAMLAQTPHTWWSTLPTTWAGQGLTAAAQGQTGSAVSYLAATAVVGALLAGAAVLLYARLFTSGWATYQEVGRGRRHGNAAERAPGSAMDLPAAADLQSRGPGVVMALARRARLSGAASTVSAAVGLRQIWRPWLRKEWLSLRRNPTLWTQLIYGLVVMGVGVYRTISHHTSYSASVGVRTDTVVFFFTLAISAYLPVVFLAPRLVNGEGRALYLVALVPSPPWAILLVKAAFCALPVLVVVDAMLVAGGVALGLPAWQLALGASVFALLICAETGGLLLIGLIWPRLDWDNPSRQVSMRAGLYGTIGGLLLAVGVVAALLFALTGSGGLPAPLYGGTAVALPALVIGVAVTQAPRHFDALLAGAR